MRLGCRLHICGTGKELHLPDWGACMQWATRCEAPCGQLRAHGRHGHACKTQQALACKAAEGGQI